MHRSRIPCCYCIAPGTCIGPVEDCESSREFVTIRVRGYWINVWRAHCYMFRGEGTGTAYTHKVHPATVMGGNTILTMPSPSPKLFNGVSRISLDTAFRTEDYHRLRINLEDQGTRKTSGEKQIFHLLRIYQSDLLPSFVDSWMKLLFVGPHHHSRHHLLPTALPYLLLAFLH